MSTAVSPVIPAQSSISSDWKRQLPVLVGDRVQLRELRLSDAPSLLAMVTAPEVSRFISPPPVTVAGFERFIQWTQDERAAGRYICFAVVPHGMTTAVGLFQLRALEPTFVTAEWGFALGAPFWGTGVFMDAARLTVEFALETVGVHRLEARAAVGKRAWQRRAREDWGREGGRPASELLAQRRIHRPGALVDRSGRLASGQGGLVLDRSLRRFQTEGLIS